MFGAETWLCSLPNHMSYVIQKSKMPNKQAKFYLLESTGLLSNLHVIGSFDSLEAAKSYVERIRNESHER